LTKECFQDLRLCGVGMEFASEMVIKAALKSCRIAEVPVTLSKDLRDRPPHLRPWRDGWRHLRYLLMLSPAWLFGMPAVLLGAASFAVLLYAAVIAVMGQFGESYFGNYWVILAGAMLGVSQSAGILAAATQLYGVREGYRRPGQWTNRHAKWISLETMLLTGLTLVALGFLTLAVVVGWWSASRFGRFGNVLPAVAGTTLIVMGFQNMLGGFLLAILNGNEAEFFKSDNTSTVRNEPHLVHSLDVPQETRRAASR